MAGYEFEASQAAKIPAARDTSGRAVVERLRAAQRLLKGDRRRGFAALNELFRAGTLPNPPLDGQYTGELVALDVAPGLTQLGQLIAAAWMPWKGKRFEATAENGDNIFNRDSLALARVLWPLYGSFVDDSSETFRAFSFRTYVAPGKADPDRQVLKIDYNLETNPRLTIRRVLDELVQISDGFYLGKAHLKWWWGRWQVVAYFLLRTETHP